MALFVMAYHKMIKSRCDDTGCGTEAADAATPLPSKQESGSECKFYSVPHTECHTV